MWTLAQATILTASLGISIVSAANHGVVESGLNDLEILKNDGLLHEGLENLASIVVTDEVDLGQR